jgi:hypothetical protein
MGLPLLTVLKHLWHEMSQYLSYKLFGRNCVSVKILGLKFVPYIDFVCWQPHFGIPYDLYFNDLSDWKFDPGNDQAPLSTVFSRLTSRVHRAR